MKHLANCTPTEFLKQTVRIKHAASEWMTKTDIANIRKRKPVLADNMTDDEKREALERQSMENASALFDELAEKHPDETLAMMALMCFVEPEDVDEHTMTEYFAALADMLGSPAVIRFFIALARLGKSGIFRA